MLRHFHGRKFGESDTRCEVFQLFIIRVRDVAIHVIECRLHFIIHDKLLHKRSPETSNDIVIEKFFASPYILQRSAKHPQCKHVEEYMSEISMHEHVCEKLPPPEF